MVRTLNSLQEVSRLISSTKPKEYKHYSFDIDPGDGTIEVDIGGDLKDKYSSEHRIPCTNGFISAESDVQLRFNALTEDLVLFDVSLMGNFWHFTRGDLLIDKIFLARPYGAAVHVDLFVSGCELIHLDETP